MRNPNSFLSVFNFQVANVFLDAEKQIAYY